VVVQGLKYISYGSQLYRGDGEGRFLAGVKGRRSWLKLLEAKN